MLHCVCVPSLTPLSVLGQLNADSSIMPSLLQPKHQDVFSLAPQRPLTTINPIGHSLHPNGAPTLKPSPVPRTIQAMPWEQRSLYNQWDPPHAPGPFFPPQTPPTDHHHHPGTNILLIVPADQPLHRHYDHPALTSPPPPTPPRHLSWNSTLLWDIVFGGKWERARWELVEIDYWVV